MKPLLHVVELAGVSILQQLQWEEALLRADVRNWCLFNQYSTPAIVMGIGGQVEAHVCLEKMQQKPLPLIRRFSGGGTVVVDEGTLFVTLVCQAQALEIPPFPKPLMQWSAELYRPLFPTQPFALRENDYVFGERKWGGNAQSIVKGRWLHHSSLLWDYQPSYMEYLKLPPKMPFYREGRAHHDFLCRLRDHLSSPSVVYAQLREQLGQHFMLKDMDRLDLEQVAALPHRRATCLITQNLN